MKSPNFEFHLNGIIKSMHRLIFISLFIFTNTFIYSQQPAFPTANGGGSNATGGRGQSVYHVTNLNDSGAGSFRDAVSQGNRTIVFDVSGTIEILLSNGTISFPSNITIAGQTAPEGGITIVGPVIGTGGSDNIIIRYVKFRHTLPDGNWGGDDALYFANSDNVILDHCSFSWGGDEIVTFLGNSADITIQNCLFAEGKTGSIFGDSDNNSISFRMSFLRNMFYNVPHRQPNANSDDRQDIINNVVFNWKNRLSVVQGTNKINHISNYYSMGNLNSIDQVGMQLIAEEGQQIYTSGNMLVNEGVVILDKTDNPWDYAGNTSTNTNCLFQDRGDGWGPYPAIDPDLYTNLRKDTPHPDLVNPPTIIEADVLIDTLKDDCGANASLNADGSVTKGHDPLDTVYINGIVAETGISYDANSGGHNFHTTDHWNTFWASVSNAPINSRPANFDTDNDGMPDAWETANFGDLTKDGTGDDDGDGYTDLEEYLNGVDGPAGEPIMAEGVTVTPASASINIPETIQLSKLFVPANTTNQNGIWSSNNPAVATVSGSGLVTPISEGDAIITFTANDGGFSDSSIITVTNILIPVSDVSVTPNDITLDIDETIQLIANVTPSNATNLEGVWSSSNTNVAIIDDQGLVTGLSEGTATITFTSDDDNAIFDTSIVNVIDTFYGIYEFYNAQTDEMIQEISDDAVFDLNAIGDQVNFRCIPQGGDTNADVESVQVQWTGVENGSWIESDPIYAGMTNHSEFNFEPYTVVEGIYNFTVTYFSQDNGGGNVVSVDTFSLTFYSNAEIIANAGEDKNICENESVTLTASGGPNYLWNTGETTQSITVSPLETTTYTVTVSNDLVSDTDDVVVIVNPIPLAYAGEERAILSGDSIPLTASGGSEFLWSTGETTQEIIVSPTETTTYTVEVFENGCSDIASVTVIVGVSASVGGEQTICQGQSTTLYASGGSYYEWNTGETTQSIEVSPSQTTTYSVVVSNNSSSDEAEITVSVNLVPAADAGEDVTIESGQNVTLTASGGNTYLWSTGETSQNISVSPSDTTIYTVETFVNGCSNTDDVKVTVVQQVNANAGDDVEICLGESTTLTASGGNSYYWSNGETTQSISVSPNETTSYSVEVSNGFSTQSADVIVGVLDCQTIGSEPEDSGFEFRVFPNPTKNNANIKLVGLENVSSIFISDMKGQVISSESFEPNNGYVINKRYDLSSLARGIYLITFKQMGKPAITKKLILN